ncbi:hypothetical protein [uncultured Desulfuromonas sp.]|uniref:hypothetical protein n=1 Tax=uncultured Desulfuromonas sp. TaxID=181013 RepID=UPI002AAB1B5D|nr:hypothetical protein [uncultured Desulfuromonas sp.]
MNNKKRNTGFARLIEIFGSKKWWLISAMLPPRTAARQGLEVLKRKPVKHPWRDSRH